MPFSTSHTFGGDEGAGYHVYSQAAWVTFGVLLQWGLALHEAEGRALALLGIAPTYVVRASLVMGCFSRS